MIAWYYSIPIIFFITDLSINHVKDVSALGEKGSFVSTQNQYSPRVLSAQAGGINAPRSSNFIPFKSHLSTA
jgi:hypothetical protein